MTEDQISKFFQRIDKLTLEHKASFGLMTFNQMICHCTDQLRIALGTMTLGDQGQVDPAEIIKLAKSGQLVPTPKGLGQVEGDGTKPTNLESDKQILKKHITDFSKLPADFDYPVHPYFGKIDKARWISLVVYHLNHHLEQFKV